MAADELLTIPQVAERLKCHRDTVYADINAGRLKATFHRGRRRVRESELRRFMAALDDPVSAPKRRRAS